MNGESTVEMTITIVDPDLDEEELEEETRNIYRCLREVDELETVDYVPDPNPPEKSKGGGYLPGILKAEAEQSNLKYVSEAAYEVASGKLEVKLKGKGKEVTVEASNRSKQEFSEAVQKALD